MGEGQRIALQAKGTGFACSSGPAPCLCRLSASGGAGSSAWGLDSRLRVLNSPQHVQKR